MTAPDIDPDYAAALEVAGAEVATRRPRPSDAETLAILAEGAPASVIVHRRADTITPAPIRWLWPGRVAAGKLTVIAGRAGLGKSQITASLTAIVTTGGRWPVDRTSAPRGHVIICSAEDDPADTIVPRLMAAGADRSRVHVVDAVHETDAEGRMVRRTMDMTRDIEAIRDMVIGIGNVAMIVIDPVTAYCGGADTHRVSDVRGMLAPLSDLAAEHGPAVICVTHLRKAAGQAATAVTGSTAWIDAPRAAYLVTPDPEDEARRMILPAKNNIGDDRTGYAYRIVPATVDGEIETSRIEWAADHVTVSADDALAAAQSVGGEPIGRQVAEWLVDLLGDGPMSARDVQVAAREAGHAWRTVQAAMSDAGVTSRREGFGAGARYMWSIADPHARTSAQTSTSCAHGAHDARMEGADTTPGVDL